jgi:uncharacterized membrane protein
VTFGTRAEGGERATLPHMMTIILALHIAAGSIALASMCLPLVARKGGSTHRRAGWVFVGGMTVVSVTAFLLSAARVLTDPTPDGRAAGAFLFFVSILTATGVSAGIRVLRFKRRAAPHRHPWDLGLAATLVVASVAMAVWGLSGGRSLFTAFSVIGLLTGGNQIVSWLRVPTHPMHWWFDHMGAMLGACIAATTAFLVVNAGRLGFETFALAVWLAPSVVGTVAIALWTAYYRRRFAGVAAESSRRRISHAQDDGAVELDRGVDARARHGAGHDGGGAVEEPRHLLG